MVAPSVRPVNSPTSCYCPIDFTRGEQALGDSVRRCQVNYHQIPVTIASRTASPSVAYIGNGQLNQTPASSQKIGTKESSPSKKAIIGGRWLTDFSSLDYFSSQDYRPVPLCLAFN